MGGWGHKTNECFMPCLSMQQFPRLLRSCLPPMALGVCAVPQGTEPPASHRAPPSPLVSGGDVQPGGTCRKRSIFIQKRHGFGQALPYLQISWEEHLALLELSQNRFQIAQTRYRKPELMYTASRGNFLLFWHFLRLPVLFNPFPSAVAVAHQSLLYDAGADIFSQILSSCTRFGLPPEPHAWTAASLWH